MTTVAHHDFLATIHLTIWTAATATASTESRSCDVIPWVGLRGTRVRPSNDLLANGHRAAMVLAGILDDAVRDRMLAANPARGVKLPPRSRRPNT